MTTPPWADVVIIGGGVVGLAVAYECARSGWRTVLLERDAVGSGAAGVAAGMLSPAAEADTGGEELLELAFESCRLYPEFVNAVEAVSAEPCGYRTEGSLLVALNRDHAEELERLTAFQRRSGIEVSWLDADAVLAREPALSPRVIGGLFAPGDRQVNPRRLMQALAVAITSLGSKIETGAAVLEIVTEGGRVSGVRYSSHGETSFLAAGHVVIAAGAWTATLAGHGFEELPLRPVKGQILRLHGAPLIDHVIRTPDVYLVPRSNGELVVGATSEEQGFDRTVTAGAVRMLLTEAWRVLPGIEELELREVAASLRPALRDNLPVIGPATLPGLFYAIGHYRHGVMLAPATARLLVETMRSGCLPTLLTPFQANRFEPIAATSRTTE